MVRALASPQILVATLDGRATTVIVAFGEATDEASHLDIHFAGAWWPIVSCSDWYGNERRDDLTAANVRELVAQLGAEVL